ncbi:carbohydrate kinase family protein [Oryzibacter oryziterrae]|uniref:carbohydrate kinase family protein n=1 Tax=Oryzibacter oryziterrae TaxID=2766474 RepID=UPI001F2EB482|nr:sugar kinase [Oryzibacter oryziterrae]
MARFDAIFVGLTILDVAGRPVERVPDGGGVAFIEEIRLNPAGTAAGAVMNAAKLGISTATIACLGHDEKADFILAVYKRLGIDTSLVQFTDKAPTSATILPIRPNGERPALHARGASDHLFVSDADFDRATDARFLHLGGTGLLRAMDGGQSAKLLAHAKARGVVTTFDLIAPNPSTLTLLDALLPHVDYFMPSFEEASYLSGLDTPEAAAAFFLDRGAGAVVFKLGARGSYTRTRDHAFYTPAFKVAVSDTTGCGDSYCGAFIAGLSQGLSLEDACRLGSATAALVATGLGSDAGVSDLAQVQAFMASAETRD